MKRHQIAALALAVPATLAVVRIAAFSSDRGLGRGPALLLLTLLGLLPVAGLWFAHKPPARILVGALPAFALVGQIVARFTPSPAVDLVRPPEAVLVGLVRLAADATLLVGALLWAASLRPGVTLVRAAWLALALAHLVSRALGTWSATGWAFTLIDAAGLVAAAALLRGDTAADAPSHL